LEWTADVKDPICELCSHEQITASKFREERGEGKEKERKKEKKKERSEK
jgi:hypothetical protein